MIVIAALFGLPAAGAYVSGASLLHATLIGLGALGAAVAFVVVYMVIMAIAMKM